MQQNTQNPVVCVTGSRSWRNVTAVFWELDRVRSLLGEVSAVWHGGAAGADLLAAEWARYRRINSAEWPAEWSQGRAAGPRRNAAMVAALPAGSVVVAFAANLAESRGTAHTVRLALRRGLRVWYVGREAGRWLAAAEELTPCMFA